MALGQLVVRLGLDAAEFTSGMSKAERDAYKFGESIGTGLKTAALGAAAAVAAIGFAAKETFDFLNSNIQATAKFQDLAEKVGDTAENFASLKKASDVSGVSLDGVAAASIKLTSALSKTDEDGQGAAKAIKALGLNFDDFKKQSPAEQMDTVAKALVGFEDGANKTAVAVALFGKAGADLLPFLNDLADGSERQISLTGDQIKAANDFSESMARLASDSNTLKQQLVAQLIPTMSDLVKLFTDSGNEAGNAANKTAPFAAAMDFIKDEMRKTVATTYELIGAIKKLYAGVAGFTSSIGALFSGDLDGVGKNAQAARAEIAALDKQYSVLANTARAAGNVIGKSPLSGAGFGEAEKAKKPTLNFSGIKTKSSSAAKGLQIEDDGYAKLLQDTNKYINVVRELNKEETFLSELREGKYAKLTILQQESIRNEFAKGDAMKAALKDDEALANQQAKHAAEEVKRIEDGKKLGESIRLSTLTDLERLQEEQAALNLLMQAPEPIISLDTYNRKMADLKQRIDDLKAPLTEWQTLAKSAGESLASGLADAIVQGKSLGDVFKNVVKQLAAMILKALIFKSLQIGLNAISPGLGTAIFGKAGGGDVNQSKSYLVGEKGPEIFTPKQSGNIIPNNQLSNSGTMAKQQSNVYNISAGGVSREEFMAGLNRSQEGAVTDIRQNRLRRRA